MGKNKTNTRLMVAAPEMYEIITKLVEGIRVVELLVRVNPELVKKAEQLLERIDGKDE